MSGSPKIIVIDDNPAIRNIVSQTVGFLSPEAVCYEAENGQAGLDLVKEIQSAYSERPKLIICDLEMPIMDGWEFIKHMKKECDSNSEEVGIPIIVLSASSGEERKFLTRKSVHDNKTGYIPLVTIAKDDCVDPKKYSTTQAKGLIGWIKYFLAEHKWEQSAS